jgi:hypothetical protein
VCKGGQPLSAILDASVTRIDVDRPSIRVPLPWVC